jgi:hypothetical protein
MAICSLVQLLMDPFQKLPGQPRTTSGLIGGLAPRAMAIDDTEYQSQVMHDEVVMNAMLESLRYHDDAGEVDTFPFKSI